MRIVIRIKIKAFTILMHKRNLDKLNLAFKIKTSPQYLSEMIAGRRNPSPEMRKRIQRSLGRGVKWDDIFQVEEHSDTVWA